MNGTNGRGGGDGRRSPVTVVGASGARGTGAVAHTTRSRARNRNGGRQSPMRVTSVRLSERFEESVE